MAEKLRALVICSHPGPSGVVTAIAGILAIGLGYEPLRVVLVLAAVLSGQLSVGWSNDWLDSARDAAVGRRDKPTVSGAIAPATLRNAAIIAAIATIVLSFLLGPWAGISHLVGVGMGWWYNAGLKNTVFSVVPYLVFFGLLPLVVTLGRSQPEGAAWWAIAAGALLGAGAHFANALPDLEHDRATGIRGLPHLLGRRVSGVGAFALLVAAAAALTWGAHGVSGSLIGLGLAVAVAIVGATLALTRPPTRTLMRLVMLSALIDVTMLAVIGLRP